VHTILLLYIVLATHTQIVFCKLIIS